MAVASVRTFDHEQKRMFDRESLEDLFDRKWKEHLIGEIKKVWTFDRKIKEGLVVSTDGASVKKTFDLERKEHLIGKLKKVWSLKKRAFDMWHSDMYPPCFKYFKPSFRSEERLNLNLRNVWWGSVEERLIVNFEIDQKCKKTFWSFS